MNNQPEDHGAPGGSGSGSGGSGGVGGMLGSAMSGYAGKLRGATDIAGGHFMESVGHTVGSDSIAQEGIKQRQQGQAEWSGTARDRLPAPGPDADVTGGRRDLGPQGYAAQGSFNQGDQQRDGGSQGGFNQGGDYNPGRGIDYNQSQGGGRREGSGYGADIGGAQNAMDEGSVQGSRDVGSRGGQGYPSTQNASRW